MKLALTPSQNLTLTPQLQQAIQLLSLSLQELETEIQSMLERNPLLEITEETPLRYTAPPLTSIEHDSDPIEEHTLIDHLLWQLAMNSSTAEEYTMGSAIIGNLDDNGYLTCPLTEIQDFLKPQVHSLDRLRATQKKIQHFDPLGVACDSLKECLLTQCHQRFQTHPLHALLVRLIHAYLPALAEKNFSDIQRRLHLSEETLKEVLALLHLLDPKPGLQINPRKPEFIIPDAFVRLEHGSWVIQPNQTYYPTLRIQTDYAKLLHQVPTGSEKHFIQSHLQEAHWFLKTLAHRQDLLVKVVQYIVSHQQAFLEHGDLAMRPLILKEVAQALNVHESTISRITTQKYIDTPRGIYELKYFFSNPIPGHQGAASSATAIKALIKKLILAEQAQKPLNDGQLCALLSAQGIPLARRTIAKYREALGIPVATARQQP